MILWGVSRVSKTSYGQYSSLCRVSTWPESQSSHTWDPVPGDLVSTQLEMQRGTSQLPFLSDVLIVSGTLALAA